jgi:hypothetical protein
MPFMRRGRLGVVADRGFAGTRLRPNTSPAAFFFANTHLLLDSVLESDPVVLRDPLVVDRQNPQGRPKICHRARSTGQTRKSAMTCGNIKAMTVPTPASFWYFMANETINAK